MKKVFQDELYRKYPKIFRQKDDPMTATCMCWGIDCGDGWYPIIDFLCRQLQWDIDKNGYPQIEASQVKEKFGTLRFYYQNVTLGGNVEERERQLGVQEGMITTIEHLSGYVCEGCGINKGVFQTKGWIRTTCQPCEDKRGK